MRYWLKRFIYILSVFFFSSIVATMTTILSTAVLLQWFISDLKDALPYMGFFGWIIVVLIMKNIIYSQGKSDRINKRFCLKKMSIILIIVSIIMIFPVLNMGEVDPNRGSFIHLPYMWLSFVIGNVLISISILFIIMIIYFLFIYNKGGSKYLNKTVINKRG